MSTLKTTNITHGSNSGTANLTLASGGGVTTADTLTVPTKKFVCPGTIIQVQSANFTGTASTTSSSWTDTGLQVVITPTATSSKVMLMATLSSGTSNVGYQVHYRFDGVTTTAVGDAGGSAFQSGMSNKVHHVWGNDSMAMNFIDSPNSTSAITYKLQFATTNNGVYTVYLNRSQSQDGNTGATMANLTAMELAQ